MAAEVELHGNCSTDWGDPTQLSIAADPTRLRPTNQRLVGCNRNQQLSLSMIPLGRRMLLTWVTNRSKFGSREGGYYKVVQMLISAGADVNALSGGEYDTTLQAACGRGYNPVVQMLIDAGADVNLHTGGKYGSPLQAALAHHRDTVVQILMDAGADVNAQKPGSFALDS